jgi:hypothetical protein
MSHQWEEWAVRSPHVIMPARDQIHTQPWTFEIMHPLNSELIKETSRLVKLMCINDHPGGARIRIGKGSCTPGGSQRSRPSAPKSATHPPQPHVALSSPNHQCLSFPWTELPSRHCSSSLVAAPSSFPWRAAPAPPPTAPAQLPRHRSVLWYVSNVSIIFGAPCLFIHHLLCILLHFVAFLCIFRN